MKLQDYTRVSTLIAGLDDPYSLNAWRLRQCVKGLGARSDLFARGAAAAAADDRRELDQVVEAAVEAARSSEGANVGTAVHSFTQQVDEGRTPHIPDPWRAPVEAYQRAMTAAGLTVDPAWCEACLWIPDLNCVGTADRVVTTPDGRRLIADVKTGRLDYLFSPKLAAQLAAYSRAAARWTGSITFDRFGRYRLGDVEHDDWQPVTGIDPDVGVVVHIDPGTAVVTVRYVNLEEGWRWAKLGRKLYDTRKLKLAVTEELPPVTGGHARTSYASGRPLPARIEPTEPSTVSEPAETAEVLRGRIRHGLEHDGFEQALRRRWPTGVPGLAATNGHAHTGDELDLVAAAVTRAEADASVPF